MSEGEGIYSQAKKQLQEQNGEPSSLKTELSEKLEVLKAETAEHKQDLTEITGLMKSVLTVELESANIDRDIRLLIKAYLERKTK